MKKIFLFLMLVQCLAFGVGYKDVPKLREIFEAEMGVELKDLVIGHDGKIEYFNTFARHIYGNNIHIVDIAFENDTCTITALEEALQVSPKDILRLIYDSDKKMREHFTDELYEYDQEYVRDDDKNLHYLYTNIKAKGHTLDPVTCQKEITRWICFLQTSGTRFVYQLQLDDQNAITSLQQSLTSNLDNMLRSESRSVGNVFLSSEPNEDCWDYITRFSGGSLCMQLFEVFNKSLETVNKYRHR